MLFSHFVIRILSFGFLLMVLLFSSSQLEAQSPPVARLWSFPLGYRDGVTYSPIIAYDNNGNLLVNTDYGVKNPSLSGTTCFGVDWSQIWHAGEDWFRRDGNNTRGAEVTAVADGKVLFADPNINYPGGVIIIQHLLSSGQNVYSMYAHLDPNSINVSNGQIISRGQRLATVLDQADNSHLHWEIRFFYDGRNIYPSPYTACNGIIPARGYTYPNYPDNFPASGTGYRDPTTSVYRFSPTFMPVVTRNISHCVDGQDLILNGGFELGRTIWTEQGSTIVTSNSAVLAHSGSWKAWFGGYNNANGILYQDMVIPSNANTAALSYYVWIGSSDSTTTPHDYLYVRVRDGNGGLLQTIDQWDNTATRGVWNQVRINFTSLGSIAGQTRRLSFEATTDGSLITDFVVDDVSAVLSCGASPAHFGFSPVQRMPVQTSPQPDPLPQKP